MEEERRGEQRGGDKRGGEGRRNGAENEDLVPGGKNLIKGGPLTFAGCNSEVGKGESLMVPAEGDTEAELKDKQPQSDAKGSRVRCGDKFRAAIDFHLIRQ